MKNEEIIARISELVPGVSIRVKTVIKNNDKAATGIKMFERENEIAPVLYLENYLNAGSIDDIAKRIVEEYKAARERVEKNPYNVDDLFSFDKVKERIYVQMVDKHLNVAALQQMPHVTINDFAICFFVQVTETTIAKVTYGLMREWNISDEGVLYAFAMRNSQRDFKANIQPVTNLSAFRTEENALERELFVRELQNGVCHNMYSLTTDEGRFGASALFYGGLLEEFCWSMHCPRVLIYPLSLNKVILEPIYNSFSQGKVDRMFERFVYECVPEEERLGSLTYIYELKQRKILNTREMFY